MAPAKWDGGYPGEFGKAASFYPPTETLVETSPDKRRSSSLTRVVDLGHEFVWLMVVRGLGVISMRATSDLATGRLHFNGLSTFTDQMLQFGLEAEAGAPR